MATFTSDQIQPIGWNTYKQIGMSLVQTIEGWVLLGHGGRDGSVNVPEAMLKKADFIAVCYPAAVKAKYPKYAHKVIGNWNVPTVIRYQYVDGITFLSVNPQ